LLLAADSVRGCIRQLACNVDCWPAQRATAALPTLTHEWICSGDGLFGRTLRTELVSTLRGLLLAAKLIQRLHIAVGRICAVLTTARITQITIVQLAHRFNFSSCAACVGRDEDHIHAAYLYASLLVLCCYRGNIAVIIAMFIVGYFSLIYDVPFLSFRLLFYRLNCCSCLVYVLLSRVILPVDIAHFEL